jgi:LacI family transcriptional regulator
MVHPDDAAISARAAQHLLERGFRSFAFCGVQGPRWSTRRRDGFVSVLDSEGYACAVHEYDATGGGTSAWDTAQDQLADWLGQLPLPAGVMVSHDLHGQFVVEACRRGGIAVPDQMAVIGVDNDEPLCEICDPPLSSVVPDDQGVGYEAARLLDRMMHGDTWDGNHAWVPPTSVITRLSTDSLAIEDKVVADAIRYIRENACKGKGVDDVVAQVPVSRSLLQRRFKMALGRTLHDEFLQVRLAHAQFLLAESDMSIAWIAERSAFNHPAYLGKVFRKELGMTPLEYRRSQQRN